jgi:hypothetical protein
MANCPICGFRIRDWVPSCPSCGVALEWEQAPGEQAWGEKGNYYRPPRNRPAWPIIGGLVLVLSVCICVFCSGLALVKTLLSEEGSLSVARVTRSPSIALPPTPLPFLEPIVTWVPAPIASPTMPLNMPEPTASSPGPFSSSPFGYSADTPLQGEAEVVINHIYCEGLVEGVESDEYVEIANVGTEPIDIGGWLLNAGDSDLDFIFPSFVLEPWQICRVYTNEHHFDTCGFSFDSPRAIWNNEGDCGYLFDVNREPVATYCY